MTGTSVTEVQSLVTSESRHVVGVSGGDELSFYPDDCQTPMSSATVTS